MSITPARARRWSRAGALVTTVIAAATLLSAPASAATPTTAAPTTVAVTRPAAVHASCHVSGCADALNAYDGWSRLGLPGHRGWYRWNNGQCNYAGGQYRNDNGQLPVGDTFQEYDVYPRTCGAHRDAYRIVVDTGTGATWYSPDHYADFYEIV